MRCCYASTARSDVRTPRPTMPFGKRGAASLALAGSLVDIEISPEMRRLVYDCPI